VVTAVRVTNVPVEKFEAARGLWRCRLPNQHPLHNGGADTESPTDLEDAHPVGPEPRHYYSAATINPVPARTSPKRRPRSIDASPFGLRD
jgi:hypothetical protein